MRRYLKIRTIGMIWLAHCLLTIGGDYFVTAMAQGVADGAVEVPLTLIVVYTIVQISSFPILTIVLSALLPQVDVWSVSGFVTFVALAAANSALWAAAIAALFAAIRKSSVTH